MGMTFASLIETDYPVFSLDEPAAQVARKLADGAVAYAPVLDGGVYAGMVSLSGLLAGRKGWPAAKTALVASELDAVPAFALDEQIFEKLPAVAAIKGDVIPLIDDQGLYAGAVSKKGILGFLAARFHAGDGSSTLEIEVPPKGARLSELIDTIEKNDASIISFTAWPSGATGEGLILFFRVVTHDFFRLIRNMENYGYLIRYHSPFPDAGYDELREKALEFIRYMEM
ncbi:MAG: CBS domain-containing protein [Chlorobiaceae bacterium]|nr:CBS domain-containing protein [Chlorobiaceae bacterium]